MSSLISATVDGKRIEVRNGQVTIDGKTYVAEGSCPDPSCGTIFRREDHAHPYRGTDGIDSAADTLMQHQHAMMEIGRASAAEHVWLAVAALFVGGGLAVYAAGGPLLLGLVFASFVCLAFSWAFRSVRRKTEEIAARLEGR